MDSHAAAGGYPSYRFPPFCLAALCHRHATGQGGNLGAVHVPWLPRRLHFCEVYLTLRPDFFGAGGVPTEPLSSRFKYVSRNHSVTGVTDRRDNQMHTSNRLCNNLASLMRNLKTWP